MAMIVCENCGFIVENPKIKRSYNRKGEERYECKCPLCQWNLPTVGGLLGHFPSFEEMMAVGFEVIDSSSD